MQHSYLVSFNCFSSTITAGGANGNNVQNNEGSSSRTSDNTLHHQHPKEEEHEFSQVLSSNDSTKTDGQGRPRVNRLRSVHEAYHHNLTKSHHRNSNSTDSNNIVDELMENSLPYHTIIIDCAPITFVDQMGAKALYQVCEISHVYVM